MKLEAVRKMLTSPTDDNISRFLDDESVVFWIDWRQEDETIAEACESTLGTGSLAGELIEDTDDGSEYYIEITYRSKRERVPLTYSDADRHCTLLTLNKVLEPDYEVRFCVDSYGGDTLGFVALSIADWLKLREQFGDGIDRRFHRIAESPNLFTDSISF